MLIMRAKGTPVMLQYTERDAGSRSSRDCVEHLFCPMDAVQVSQPTASHYSKKYYTVSPPLPSALTKPCPSELLVGSTHQRL